MSMGDEEEFESGSLGDSGSVDEEDEDEDDHPEPKLNFIRIRNDLIGILEKDSVSCVAVHSKVSFVNHEKITVQLNVLFNSFYALEAIGENFILWIIWETT